ncbi:MAG: PqqD family protein [Actinobacteria bacterium]|nr:PqqD family protein [Actinomycetota bacterium]
MDDHTPDALPEPSPDVVWRRLNDEVVLVHLPTNRIFSLNVTGARLWELLSEEGSRAAIETRIGSEFGVAAGEVTAAVDALVSELLRERLVRARSSP